MSIKQNKLIRKEARIQDIHKKVDENIITTTNLTTQIRGLSLELTHLRQVCRGVGYLSLGLAVLALALDPLRNLFLGSPALSSRISEGIGLGQQVLALVFCLLGITFIAIGQTKGK